ncbi:MAG: energy transducer TonB [Acidobacteriia bacterium]|nr:energy transducer TonB [Terriglobia bacterium]
MTIKNYVFSLCFLFVLSAGTLCADDARPEAKQLLVAAHAASDLSPILPYTLQGTVVINPGTENQKKGNITIYRDHERSRSELHVEDYLEVKLVRDNKLYIYRSTPLPVPLLGKLAETDHYWDKLAEDGDAKLGDVARKKAQNQAANCFDVKGEQRHRLCFDPERNILLEVLDARQAVEFTNYSEVDGHFFPGKITMLLELEKQEKPVLVVENIQVLKAQFAATAFAIPPHAMEFDTCENMVAAKPLETPPPEFSTTAMRRNMGSPAINVYGIIRKDGTLGNVKVLTGDTEVQQTIMETIKKWRYTPAMCGASPVASEKEIQVSIFRGGSGDGEGARRGR